MKSQNSVLRYLIIQVDKQPRCFAKDAREDRVEIPQLLPCGRIPHDLSAWLFIHGSENQISVVGKFFTYILVTGRSQFSGSGNARY
jgi:hypothetical protein